MARPGFFRVLALASAMICALSCAAAAIAFAGTQDGARVALHVKAHTIKASSTCTGWSPNAQGLPCSKYVTSGVTKQNYDVYLVVGHGDPTAGIAGVTCQVQYDNAAGQGVDVFGWTLCGDEEAVGAGSYGDWPASGGSNTITWIAVTNCQRTEIAGEGVHAVAGAFYVYAYSPDDLIISPGGTAFTIKDCRGSTSSSHTMSPRVVFSGSGGGFGDNPCLGHCWGLFPTSVNMPTTPVGAVRDSTVLFRNSATEVISGVWSVSGNAFSLVSPTGPFSIGPGQVIPVTIRFAPVTRGAATGALSTGPPCWRTIAITGLTTCSVTPPSMNFGSLAIGETKTLFAVLTNVQAAPMNGTIQITGSDFALGLTSGLWSLPPGDSILVPVVFRPQQTGTRTGVLSGGGECPEVALSGVGLVPCGIVPATGNFGTLPVGASHETEFTLTNNRQTTMSGQATVYSFNNAFSVTTGAEHFVLPPSGTHRFRVRFAPASAGTFNGNILLGAFCASLTVTGTGRAASSRCDVLPGSDLNFGLAQLGVGRTEVIRLANTGEGSFALTLDETSMHPHFSLPNGEGPFAVASGDTLDVPVRYDPLTTGVHVGTLVANSPCANVRLVGFGQRSPVACIAAVSELDFGDVPVGASREMEFYLFNYSGERALGYVSAQCTDFALTSDPSYQIAWADSQLVRVRFAPRTLGAQTCAVSVTGGCGDTIEIAGYGIAPPDTARAEPWLYAASRPNEGVQRLVYEVLAAAHVEIIIFDVVGHELARFDEGIRVPGRFEVSWDARQSSSGVYFVRIEAAQASMIRRVLLLR